jgi:membrane-associated protease RseP (regulator of RpoE activity)
LTEQEKDRGHGSVRGKQQQQDQLRGGMEVISINPNGAAAKAGIKKSDILVGLDKWETMSMDKVNFVLDHPDLATFNPVSFTIVRSGHLHKGQVRVPKADD